MGPSPGHLKCGRSWVQAQGRSNPKIIKLVDHGSGQVEPKDYKTSRSWVRAPGRSNPKTIKLVDHGSQPRAPQVW